MLLAGVVSTVHSGQVCGVQDVFAFGAANYSHARIPPDCLWMILIDADFIAAEDGEAQDYKDTFKAIAGVNMLEQHHSTVGDRGAIALAKELETNTNLKLLFLWGNSIGPVGGKALAETLKVNSVLTQLYLQENALGDAGTISLAHGLAVNSGLKKLYLGGNNMREQGALALIAALTTNTELVGIEVGDSDISTKYVTAMQRALEDSSDPVLRPSKIIRAQKAFPCAGYSRKTHCNSRGNPTVRKSGWLSKLAAALSLRKKNEPKCICTNCEDGYYGDQCEQGGYGSKNNAPASVPNPTATSIPAPVETSQDALKERNEL